MERPASQLENARPSGLKQPSKLPALSSMPGSSGLQEMSGNSVNARYGGIGSMGPPLVGKKHSISGLPEPPPKRHTSSEHPPARKTLMERAAEPTSARLHAPPPAKPIRTDSNSATVGKNSYRNTSTASTVSSISSTSTAGMRPLSRQLNDRAVGMRPPSAMEDKELAESATPGISRRKGEHTSSRAHPAPTTARTISYETFGQNRVVLVPSPENITLRKTRTTSHLRQTSTDGLQRSNAVRGASGSGTPSASQQADDKRDVSLSAAFNTLCLTPRRMQAERKPSTDRKASHQNGQSLSTLRESAHEDTSPSKIPKFSCTPTPALRHTQSLQTIPTPSLLRSKKHASSIHKTPARKVADELPVFLTKDAVTPQPRLTSTAAWDTKSRLEDMEGLYSMLKAQVDKAGNENATLDEALGIYKARVKELSELNKELDATNKELTRLLEQTRSDLHTTAHDLQLSRRDRESEVSDLQRRHEKEVDHLDLENQRELGNVRNEHQLQIANARSEAEKEAQRLRDEKERDLKEMSDAHYEEALETDERHTAERARLERIIQELQYDSSGRAEESKQEVDGLRASISSLERRLSDADSTAESLRSQLETERQRATDLVQEKQSLVSKTHFLEGNQEAQSLEFTTLNQKLQDALRERDDIIDILRKEEALRRRLNATILELRGNIRVFCRVRPLLPKETGESLEPSRIDFQQDETGLEGCKALVVHAPPTESITGKRVERKEDWEFDRVFGPDAGNTKVFEEVRDLVQSVVDGYNVSILSYGQTSAGKTHTMSGEFGIIPSSIRLLLDEISRLSTKGWAYEVEASFLEVYCESINDLLGSPSDWDDGTKEKPKGSKDKHEIHHDHTTGKTTVSNLTVESLWPPPAWSQETQDEQNPPTQPAESYTTSTVASLLDRAQANRRTAATKANERSSRSHSVFILTLRGSCAETNESSEGMLYLVDLAGSERLKASGAEGQRKAEAASINTSLSALGSVIAKLGDRSSNGGGHVPYRDSKLTYLLQSSLGGSTGSKSSRTLMLLHLSPLQLHAAESKSSLQFGAKVRNTHVGVAKKGGK